MNTLKTVIKYFIFLTIALVLLKFSYKGFELKEVWHGIRQAKQYWLLIAMICNLLSHCFRAARWKLLLIPLKYNPSILSAFISDMTGFFVNLFLPRIGELFRCTALKRLEKIPVVPSLTAVFVERFLDVVIFMMLILISTYLFYDKLKGLFSSILVNLSSSLLIYGVILLLTILIFIFFIYLLRRYFSSLYSKGIGFLKYAFRMLFDIVRYENRFQLLIYSVIIWVFYFLSIYCVLFATNSTSHLGIDAGILILVVSCVGLAAPVQGGGVGAIHILVVGVLTIFGVSDKDAILSATLIHGVQFFTACIPGGICMLFSFALKKRV